MMSSFIAPLISDVHTCTLYSKPAHEVVGSLKDDYIIITLVSEIRVIVITHGSNAVCYGRRNGIIYQIGAGGKGIGKEGRGKEGRGGEGRGGEGRGGEGRGGEGRGGEGRGGEGRGGEGRGGEGRGGEGRNVT